MDEQENTSVKNDLSAALESLFSDPQARERFEKIVSSIKDSMQESPQAATVEGAAKAQPAPGTDALATILSTPTLMENLPTLLAGMKPLPTQTGTSKTPEDRRRDLLLALKPFLSKDRERAVDLLLQISRLGAVLRMMG